MASTLIVDQIQKTGGSTTALTLPTSNASASEFLQNDGAGALSWASAAAGLSGVHNASSGVYAVPAGVTKLLVIITGGGGGGGPGSASNEGTGGGAAGTVIALITGVASDTRITIAVGGVSGGGTVGGDSTFTHTSGSGSFDTITAPGGIAGVTHAEIGAPTAPTLGASNEGLAIKGGWPSGPVHNATVGAASFWGGGGQGAYASLFVAKAAEAYGAGGGGGISPAGYRTAAAGGAGVCFIMEYK